MVWLNKNAERFPDTELPAEEIAFCMALHRFGHKSFHTGIVDLSSHSDKEIIDIIKGLQEKEETWTYKRISRKTISDELNSVRKYVRECLL
jgi:hypothetical protein